MRDPLLAPAVAFVAGILVSQGVRFEWTEAVIAGVLFAGLAILAWTSTGKSGAVSQACVLAAVAAAGILVNTLNRLGAKPTIDASARETVLIAGCVVEPSVFNLDRDQFTLEMAPHARVRVTITMREGEAPPELAYGRAVEVEARIRPIRNFQNPGSFDFETYSARRDIFWTASARGADAIKAVPGSCGSGFVRPIFAMRTAALKRIEALYPNNAYSIGMMESILIGDSTKLEKTWTEDFRRTGTFHALVISGLHIAVLAGSVMLLLRLCFVGELPALAIAAAVTWIYVLVSGSSAPAIRAAGGFSLYLIGRYFYRERRIMNLLAVVAMVYLAWDPGQLFEASFQLSFLSVAAIGVLAAPIIEKTSARYRQAARRIQDQRRDFGIEPLGAQFRVELRLMAETLSYYLHLPQRWLLGAMALAVRGGLFAYEMVVISAVMQVGLALPMAIYFHRISFSGLSANVIIVPLLSLLVPVGFFAIFSGWALAARLAGWLLTLSEMVARWHTQWEPDWRVPDPPLWLAIAFAAALVGLAFTLNGRRVWRWLALSVVAGLFVLVFRHPFPPRIEAGTLEVTAIDVGQGDSLLVVTPKGKLMLVDGGGLPAFGRKVKAKLDIGEDVVSPYLWGRSIAHVDVVVSTHSHEDHAGGLAAVIDNFHPSELWTGVTRDEPVWRDVALHARSQGVAVVRMASGRSFDFGGARVEVVSPPEDYETPENPSNDDSLVLRVGYGKHAFLLTGDMEKGMEGRALFDGRAVRADVLKVAHHGSRTSSTELFLESVHPDFAIISDGFENLFGNPHRDVLERLARNHARILRTDTAGAITVRSDGRRLSIETRR